MAITPAKAGWDLVAFSVRTVAKGATWSATLKKEECCLVLMSGECEVTWRSADGHQGQSRLGPRQNVFASYPHVPLLLIGKGIAKGEYLGAVSPTDVAPTLAFLANVTLPHPNGRVLTEALTK